MLFVDKQIQVRMAERCTSREDRISSLPDELLLLIIDKLDTRTTITTIILSKRWRDLPRLCQHPITSLSMTFSRHAITA